MSAVRSVFRVPCRRCDGTGIVEGWRGANSYSWSTCGCDRGFIEVEAAPKSEVPQQEKQPCQTT